MKTTIRALTNSGHNLPLRWKNFERFRRPHFEDSSLLRFPLLKRVLAQKSLQLKISHFKENLNSEWKKTSCFTSLRKTERKAFRSLLPLPKATMYWEVCYKKLQLKLTFTINCPNEGQSWKVDCNRKDKGVFFSHSATCLTFEWWVSCYLSVGGPRSGAFRSVSDKNFLFFGFGICCGFGSFFLY